MSDQQPEKNESSAKRAHRRRLVQYIFTGLLLASIASIATAWVVMRTISARVVHHEVVHKDVGRLAEQINDLRKEVDRITGKPSLDAAFDSESPPPGPASKRAFRQEFARLQREVIDLALAINQLDAEPDGGPAANRVLHEITDASAAFDIAVTGPVRNRSITIRNIGEEVVDNPRVTVNGKKQ